MNSLLNALSIIIALSISVRSSGQNTRNIIEEHYKTTKIEAARIHYNAGTNFIAEEKYKLVEEDNKDLRQQIKNIKTKNNLEIELNFSVSEYNGEPNFLIKLTYCGTKLTHPSQGTTKTGSKTSFCEKVISQSKSPECLKLIPCVIPFKNPESVAFGINDSSLIIATRVSLA